ncbi:MAG: LysR family transcriptional regulator [Cognatishimia sp.]
MKDFDFYKLDGQLLRTFLTILEESSVSRAAERLEVTQSTVSHSLNKLRNLLGDPLFIRSGQGLTPTELALSLKAPVLLVLDNMRALTNSRPFDPKSEKMSFVVAANDLQRDLIFPDLLRQAWANDVDLTLELAPSGVPSVGLLRDARCDLILTPLPPDAADLIQQKLFSGKMMLFYDALHRSPPKNIDEYLAARHMTVHFALGGASDEVVIAPELTIQPKPVVTVSNFAGIPPFLLGTDLVTTQVEHMSKRALSQLNMAELPFATEPVSFYLVWHQRSTNDPAHRWLREKVRAVVQRKML